MTTETQVKWAIEADYLQACNCDYGCPCEFEAPPSQGFCQGVGAYRINQGKYGDVSLDGLAWAYVVHFPQAVHEGNGTMGILIDERASQQQREALQKILYGEAGGLPFEIFPAVVSNFLAPQYVPFQFDLNGKHSSVKVGDEVSIALEPIRNPVTGEQENMRIEHETGFIFKGADVVSAKECVANLDEVKFSWPNQAGFVTRVNYSNGQ